MDVLTVFLNEFNIKNKIFKLEDNFANYYLSKITYNNGYKKENIKSLSVNFLNLSDVFNIINLSENYENAFFTLNTDVDYDNKLIGGRIIFKIYNTKNNYNSNFINNIILSKILDEKSKKNVPYIQRGFFSLCFLLLIKNYFIKNTNLNIFNKNINFDYINSMEGIILQKDETNIKIIIHINKDYQENDIKNLINLFKEFLHIKKEITLRYSAFNKKKFIKDIFY